MTNKDIANVIGLEVMG